MFENLRSILATNMALRKHIIDSIDLAPNHIPWLTLVDGDLEPYCCEVRYDFVYRNIVYVPIGADWLLETIMLGTYRKKDI